MAPPKTIYAPAVTADSIRQVINQSVIYNESPYVKGFVSDGPEGKPIDPETVLKSAGYEVARSGIGTVLTALMLGMTDEEGKPLYTPEEIMQENSLPEVKQKLLRELADAVALPPVPEELSEGEKQEFQKQAQAAQDARLKPFDSLLMRGTARITERLAEYGEEVIQNGVSVLYHPQVCMFGMMSVILCTNQVENKAGSYHRRTQDADKTLPLTENGLSYENAVRQGADLGTLMSYPLTAMAYGQVNNMDLLDTSEPVGLDALSTLFRPLKYYSAYMNEPSPHVADKTEAFGKAISAGLVNEDMLNFNAMEGNVDIPRTLVDSEYNLHTFPQVMPFVGYMRQVAEDPVQRFGIRQMGFGGNIVQDFRITYKPDAPNHNVENVDSIRFTPHPAMELYRAAFEREPERCRAVLSDAYRADLTALENMSSRNPSRQWTEMLEAGRELTGFAKKKGSPEDYRAALEKTEQKLRAYIEYKGESGSISGADGERLDAARTLLDKVSKKNRELNPTRSPLWRDAQSLNMKMTSNVRGSRPNSPAYERVLQALHTVTAHEDFVRDLNGREPSPLRMAKMQEAYQTLRTETRLYLNNRDPSTKEGRIRYFLVQEANRLARNGLESYKIPMGAALSGVTPEMQLADYRMQPEAYKNELGIHTVLSMNALDTAHAPEQELAYREAWNGLRRSAESVNPEGENAAGQLEELQAHTLSFLAQAMQKPLTGEDGERFRAGCELMAKTQTLRTNLNPQQNTPGVGLSMLSALSRRMVPGDDMEQDLSAAIQNAETQRLAMQADEAAQPGNPVSAAQYKKMLDAYGKMEEKSRILLENHSRESATDAFSAMQARLAAQIARQGLDQYRPLYRAAAKREELENARRANAERDRKREEERLKREEDARRKEETARRKAEEEIRSAESNLSKVRSDRDTVASNDRDMETRMMEMMGPDAKGSEFLMNRNPRIYKPGQYTPRKRDYGNTGFSAKDIALINTAALCQPAAACHGGWGNGNPTDMTNVASNFVIMYQNIMVSSELRQGSGEYIDKTYNTARELGEQAIQAYDAGMKGPLAQLLGDSVRAHNEFCMGCGAYSPVINTIVRNNQRMIELLERDPELMQQSGLTQEDMKRCNATIATARLYEDNLDAQEKLYQNALGQIELSPEEREQNLSTVLLYQSVTTTRIDLIEKQRTDSPEAEQVLKEITRAQMSLSALRAQSNARREELDRNRQRLEKNGEETETLEAELRDWDENRLPKQVEGKDPNDTREFREAKLEQLAEERKKLEPLAAQQERSLTELQQQIDSEDKKLSSITTRLDTLGADIAVLDSQSRLSENYEEAKKELLRTVRELPETAQLLKTEPKDLIKKLSMPTEPLAWSRDVEKRAEQLEPANQTRFRKAESIIRDTAAVIGDSDKIRSNLKNILEEPREYIRVGDGKHMKIAGSHNDPASGTLGKLEVFAGPEYKDQPFSEVSRNMESHFKMYCLSKGMTEKELLSLRGQVSPELRDKLRDWKDGFMQMVIDKNTEEISNMYVNIGRMLEEDGTRFRNVSPLSNLAKDDPALILKYAGSQSWLEQTLPHKGPHGKPGAAAMVERINAKLKARGKDYTYDHMSIPVSVIETIAQMRIEDKDLQTDAYERMTAAPINFLRPAAVTIPLREMMSRPVQEGGSWLSGLVPGEEGQKTGVEILEKFGAKPLDFLAEAEKRAAVLEPAPVSRSVFNPKTDEISSLQQQLQNNVRRGLFGGVKENSPEYQRVLDAGTEAARLEREMDALRKSGRVPDENARRALSAAYQKVEEKSQAYLSLRDPNSAVGKSRYALIGECRSFAHQRRDELDRELKAALKPVKSLTDRKAKIETVRLNRDERMKNVRFGNIIGGEQKLAVTPEQSALIAAAGMMNYRVISGAKDVSREDKLLLGQEAAQELFRLQGDPRRVPEPQQTVIAQKLVKGAAADYVNGIKGPLAKILGDSLRQHDIACLGAEGVFSAGRAVALEQSEKLLELLQSDPELEKQSGFTGEDMERHKAAAAYGRLFRDSLNAADALSRHAAGQQVLEKEELRDHAAVIALFDSVEKQRRQQFDSANLPDVKESVRTVIRAMLPVNPVLSRLGGDYEAEKRQLTAEIMQTPEMQKLMEDPNEAARHMADPGREATIWKKPEKAPEPKKELTPEERFKQETAELNERIAAAQDGPHKQVMEMALAARNRLDQHFRENGAPYKGVLEDLKVMTLEYYLVREPAQAQKFNLSTDPGAVGKFLNLDAGERFRTVITAITPQKNENGEFRYSKDAREMMQRFARGDGVKRYSHFSKGALNAVMDKAFPGNAADKKAPERAPKVKENPVMGF